MKRFTIPALALGHTFIHVATFGLDDLIILIIVGVYLLCHSK